MAVDATSRVNVVYLVGRISLIPYPYLPANSILTDIRVSVGERVGVHLKEWVDGANRKREIL
eukprot:scaffold9446_cov72-Skeletonema_dohrnii-CCMP3373.AAC.6